MGKNPQQSFREVGLQIIFYQHRIEIFMFFCPEQIGSDTKIVIVNTVNLKGTWENAFNRSLTAPRRFYPINKDPLDVMTMHTIGRFRLGRLDDISASFIELPCKVINFTMMNNLFFQLFETKLLGFQCLEYFPKKYHQIFVKHS